jgi:hypothetical protein
MTTMTTKKSEKLRGTHCTSADMRVRDIGKPGSSRRPSAACPCGHSKTRSYARSAPTRRRLRKLAPMISGRPCVAGRSRGLLVNRPRMSVDVGSAGPLGSPYNAPTRTSPAGVSALVRSARCSAELVYRGWAAARPHLRAGDFYRGYAAGDGAGRRFLTSDREEIRGRSRSVPLG